MSPEQPMASSSAWGARTTADDGRLDPNMRVDRDGCRLARVGTDPVVQRRLVDQLVECGRRSPSHGRGRVEDGQLLDRLRLLVEGAVNQARVDMLDRAR